MYNNTAHVLCYLGICADLYSKSVKFTYCRIIIYHIYNITYSIMLVKYTTTVWDSRPKKYVPDASLFNRFGEKTIVCNQ